MFRQSYPAVHMQTREMNTREQIAPLNEGTLDLGLLRNTQLPETLEREIILHEPLMAMIPRAHPLAQNPWSRWPNWRMSHLSFDPMWGQGCMTIFWA